MDEFINNSRCHCMPGLCGPQCSEIDPCYETYQLSASEPHVTADGGNGTGAARWVRGPCQNGGGCRELCSQDQPLYECQCVDGWAGKNCTEQVTFYFLLIGYVKNGTKKFIIMAILILKLNYWEVMFDFRI